MMLKKYTFILRRCFLHPKCRGNTLIASQGRLCCRIQGYRADCRNNFKSGIRSGKKLIQEIAFGSATLKDGVRTVVGI